MSGWDSDFATEAYRQQVEALAQHQVSALGNNIAYRLGLDFIDLLINITAIDVIVIILSFVVDGRAGM